MNNKFNLISECVHKKQGALHLIPIVINQVESIMKNAGYIQVYANEVDSEWFNFTVLNIDENHPTRSNHQSFFCNNGLMLRTQTSNAQARVFLELEENFKVFTIGRTYRNDNDATHTPMFHQMEILVHSNKSSVYELIGLLKWFMSQFLYEGKKIVEIRLRTSYFPFTVPSYEVDIWHNNRWLEVLGCGITHENVFKNINQNFKYVMAAGCGIERLAMIKYGLNDIRKFYDKQPYSTHEIYDIYRNYTINNIIKKECKTSVTHICDYNCYGDQ